MLLISCFYIPTMKPKGKKKDSEEVHSPCITEEASALAEAADCGGIQPEALVEALAEPEKIDFSNVEIEPLFKDFVTLRRSASPISVQSR